ncbi:hypothetical protein [Dongia sp.]|uniref:hypothetical protein n=1 Tax=Dongia sp. TaxID=1977262 RepID=UPI0035B46E9D
MRKSLTTLAALGFAAAAVPAFAQSAEILTPTPVIEPAGNRYILMVLDQPDRDLTKGRSKVNMLLDTKTGKTWILEFGVIKGTNQNGYVWSEVPFNTVPK